MAATAYPQEKRKGPDPELTAIMEAERGGRLADADKLLAAAIQDAGQNSPVSRRMSLLLNRLAGLRFQQGRMSEAIAGAQRALSVDERVFGPASNRVADDLSNLGTYYEAANDDAAAEKSFERGLAIARQSPGPRSWSLLGLLNNLSEYYAQRGRTAEAQALIEEALQACGTEKLNPIPTSCSGFRRKLAVNLRRQGREGAGEGIVSDSVAADPESGRQWRTKVVDLITLGQQYEQDNSFDLAETTYRQAIELIEKNSDAKDPAWTVPQFILLGGLLHKEGRSSEAEEYFKRALEMQEHAASPERPEFARSFPVIDLINLYREEGRLGEMEAVLRQWLQVQERVLGPGHIALADTLLLLAQICEEGQEYAEAEPLLHRALEIQVTSLGDENPRVIRTLEAYAQLLRQEGKPDGAQAIEARLKSLQRKISQPADR